MAMRRVKTYRGAKCVLDIDSFHISKGELVSVMGPNGSGKSTMLQVLNGLLPIRQGAAYFLGEDIASSDAVQLRRRAALVFQDPLFIHDTVCANVSLPLRFRGLPENEIEEKVAAALVAFRCDHLSSRLAHRLSGGEAQRVCLARAFVTEPELLLLDEPFSALDPPTRKDLLAELKTAALTRQVTAILVSHSLDDVLRFAQRAVVLQDGRIVQDALPGTVLRKPVNSTIARLVGMDNMWSCQVSVAGGQGKVQINDHLSFAASEAEEEGAAWCCLPGDGFRIFEAGQLPGHAWVPLSAKVMQIIPGIGVVQVQAQAGSLMLNMSVNAGLATGLSPGQEITAAFHLEAVHIIRT